MRSRLPGVIIIGACLILSSIAFGIFFYQSRLPGKTIRVVGAATRRMGSDIIKWRLTIMRHVPVDGLKNGYTQIGGDQKTFKALLKRNGIDPGDLKVQPVNTNEVYGPQGGGPTGYNVMQSYYLISRDLVTIESLALNPGVLSDQSLIIQSSNLEYYSSKLNEIKRALLFAATSDARGRAEEIAKSTGDRIDNIESARTGVFQITEPYSTEVSDYGVYNTSTKEKDITVTVNVVFKLR